MVASGDEVTMQYQGESTPAQARCSTRAGAALGSSTFDTTQVVKGFSTALVGQTVGFRRCSP
ncbi:hypothetical protein [Humibacter ginsenosidimutans]|uniref:Uncharacterized protein n=1 Tax=Humibacter ginsenosidimutans TaxID=2599293 RepID=A0A5B8M135_9MICO|nr:hypothetical protein [Humibacter ginsenosidimutans]QDZ13422.1 hypothetical protein FPZ11_00010 [Humibacter ginsenosidimutans]